MSCDVGEVTERLENELILTSPDEPPMLITILLSERRADLIWECVEASIEV